MMMGVVINPFFDWNNDQTLRSPTTNSVIYEAHVGGSPSCIRIFPRSMRGTYAGVAHPAVIDHLRSWASPRSS